MRLQMHKNNTMDFGDPEGMSGTGWSPSLSEIWTDEPMAIISAKAKDIIIKGKIKARAAKASFPRYFPTKIPSTI